MPNDFREFARKRGRQLYVTACDLDTAERVIFGADERSEVTISQAVQASTALPIFYKPGAHQRRRLRRRRHAQHRQHRRRDREGRGPRHLLQPVPAVPEPRSIRRAQARYFAVRSLSLRPRHEDDHQPGVPDAAALAARTALRAISTDERFRGDIVLLEPREQDADYFAINPLAFWKRADAMQQGFESVRSHDRAELRALATCSRATGCRSTGARAAAPRGPGARQPRLARGATPDGRDRAVPRGCGWSGPSSGGSSSPPRRGWRKLHDLGI